LVLVVGDDHGKGHALRFLLGAGVERLAEFHDVDAALTERRTDGWRRVCRSGGNLKLQAPQQFLRHVSLTCGSPEGVSPPDGPSRTIRKGGGCVVRLGPGLWDASHAKAGQ